jgi:hypothetical protein
LREGSAAGKRNATIEARRHIRAARERGVNLSFAAVVLLHELADAMSWVKTSAGGEWQATLKREALAERMGLRDADSITRTIRELPGRDHRLARDVQPAAGWPLQAGG